jgi:hypothetical protein
MDFIHRPKSKILKIEKKLIEITTFRKLALFPSPDEWMEAEPASETS